jgi:hypothetical protein
MLRTLDELSAEGWKDTRHNFAELLVYERGDERMLYSPQEGRVISRYRIERPASPKAIPAAAPA